MIRITGSKKIKRQLQNALDINKANKNARNIEKLRAVSVVLNGYSCKEIATSSEQRRRFARFYSYS